MLVVILELEYLGFPQQILIGKHLEIRKLILLYLLPQQLHLAEYFPLHLYKKQLLKMYIICRILIPSHELSQTYQLLVFSPNIQLTMDILRSYLSIGKDFLDAGIKSTEEGFNYYVEFVDFPAFCLIYALLLIWILRRMNRQAIFRPKNWELVHWKERVKKGISTFIVNLPIVKQIVSHKFNTAFIKIEKELYEDFQKGRDSIKSKRLPEQGMKQSNIEARMRKWFEIEQKKMFSGKNSGAVYAENLEHCKEVSDFASKYMYHNPLHLDTYKEVSKMQAEILKMTYNLVTKNTAYGVVTSGGSESLIMSLYAYRKFYNKARPNIVVPNSIHAALDKGAMYFNIEVRKARLNENYEVDIAHMKSLIDSNTIALYGSYPNYPHGIIDPINEIAALALKYKIGFHVDGCLGGFVAGFLKDHEGKFSLDIDGVTSISLDHHKFGLAPKGVSCIIFKTKELRHHMYYIYTDWVGSIYATPSFPGSRSGFASAGAWYSLTHVGRKEFVDNAKRVAEATKSAAKDLAKIEGVRIIGNPELCVLAFVIDVVDCFSVSEYLSKEFGWKISALHIPKGLHVSVTLANCDNVRRKLAPDVRAAIEVLKTLPQKESSTSALYGASATLPSEAMGEEMLKKIMSVTFR